MGEDEKRRGSSTSSGAGETSNPESGVGGEVKVPYPKSVFFILSTEACERFSYYGMRAILSLYLKNLFITTNGMKPDKAEDVSTILYHTFIFLSYFTSLFGAFLADSFLGKFRTIFYISILYAIGQVVLSVGAVPNEAWGLPQQAMSFIGLAMIGFGTGGIKPCVVAFGADQFKLPEQHAEMSSFFGIFYASINFGSMISTILTPIFRKQPCFGEDECFSLAFLVPAILMVVAIVSFVIGRPGYKVTIPDFNVVSDFCKCIWEGIRKKGKGPKRDHWLDYAEPRFGPVFVSEVKAVLRVCVLFLLYPIFWALYDQQGSRWTFQATRMDGKIGSLQILPDQIQVVNAFLILVFIPIFDKGVYPLFAKFGMLKTPLQKIVTGGCLLATAFVVSAFLELALEKTYPHPPSKSYSRVAFHNGLASECDIDLTFTQNPIAANSFNFSAIVAGGETSVIWNNDKSPKQLLPLEFPTYDEETDVKPNYVFTLKAEAKNAAGETCPLAGKKVITDSVTIEPEMSKTMFFHTKNGTALEVFEPARDDYVDKSATGFPFMRVLTNLNETNPNKASEFIIGKARLKLSEFYPEKKRDKGVAVRVPLNFTSDNIFEDQLEDEATNQGKLKLCMLKADYHGNTDSTRDKPIPDEEAYICIEEENVRIFDINANKPDNKNKMGVQSASDVYQEQDEFDLEPRADEDVVLPYRYEFKYGGSYNLYLQEDDSGVYRLDISIVTPPNSVHMMWLMPQYIILTAGEVLFSITSLAFAFTQAPSSMKAVVQALFLQTNAVGNLIDIAVVALMSGVFSSQAWEFLLFAGLMFVDMGILAWLATRYEYVDYTQVESDAARKKNDDADADDNADARSIASSKM